jgi:hypothetical protein
MGSLVDDMVEGLVLLHMCHVLPLQLDSMNAGVFRLDSIFAEDG